MSKKNGEIESLENAPNEIENISKIRDILFGNNMSEYEKRFKNLEDKLAQSVAEKKAETDNRMTSLESFFKNELKIANNKLEEADEARQKGDRKMLTEVEALEESLTKFKNAISESSQIRINNF